MAQATHEHHNSRGARPGAAQIARSSTAPAEVAESLAHRDDKRGTALRILPAFVARRKSGPG